MRDASIEVARMAAPLWAGAPATLSLLGISGNAVYRFERSGTPAEDGPLVLRLTDPEHRSPLECEQEIAYLRHLVARGVRVAAPLPSARGRWVEEVDGFSASVFTWAPGLLVDWRLPQWGEPFFREWGRELARIHRASTDFSGPMRWLWRDEKWLRDAELYLSRGDVIFGSGGVGGGERDRDGDGDGVRGELARCLAAVGALPRSSSNFGMTHADFAPQNFRFEPGRGITTFDFGNACLHWFVQDLAISLSTLRRDPRRDDLRRWIVSGYQEIFPIDPTIWGALDWFFRLRIVYVYLSRLDRFGPEPTAEERAILSNMRLSVQERFSWPGPTGELIG